MATTSTRSYSQVAEDLLIAYLLGRTQGMRYIDVGCLWPIQYSNTYLFYTDGGSGLCIDANPDLAEAFEAERPRDRFMTAAIGATSGTMTYYKFNGPGFNTFSSARAERLIEQGQQNPGRRLREEVDVPMMTLDDAIAEAGSPTRGSDGLDFLSIDVEGLELDVLEGFCFEPRPRLVVCEQIRKRDEELQKDGIELNELMADRGYRLAAHTGHDVFFVDNEP